MYDRAPRVLTGTTGSTSGAVGPGKYDSDAKRFTDGKRGEKNLITAQINYNPLFRVPGGFSDGDRGGKGYQCIPCTADS